MRFLRWAALALVLVGGALGLGSRGAEAAPLPSAGLAAQGGLAAPATEQAQYYYRRGYGYRRPYFRRRFYGYRPYGYRRPFYRRRFYRRGFYY